MQRRAITLVAIVLGLATATSAQAQVPGIDLVVIPKVGAFVPLSDLGDVTDSGQTLGVSASSDLAIGLGLELDLPLSPINFRGNVEYVPSTDISVSGTTAGGDFEAEILTLVADAVYRPLPRLVVTQPYFLAGAGIKRYDFSDNDGVLQDGVSSSTSDFTLHVGAGLDVGLGPIRLLGEVSDYISWFDLAGDSNMQNDVFAMAGFRVGLF